MKKIMFLSVCLLSVLAMAGDGIRPIKEVWEPNARDYPLNQWVKVAAISFGSNTILAPAEGTPQEIRRYKKWVRQELEKEIRKAAAQGAELVVTPEFGLVGYPDIEELDEAEDNFTSEEMARPFAEAIPGPTTKIMARLADELDIYLVVGLMEKDRKKLYNASVAFSPEGKHLAKYRKMNLYQLENNYLHPGTQAVTFDTPLFGRAALIICADVYSHQPAHDLKKMRPNVTLLSTSWAAYNSGWSAFTGYARSHQQYFIAANQPYFPDTGVINPDGSAQSHIRQSRAGITYGYIPRLR